MKNNQKKRTLRIAVATVKMHNQGIEAIEELIDKAASCAPDIIVLTESLYTRNCGVDSAPVPGPCSYFMAGKCRQFNIYIVFNLWEICTDGKLRNCNVLMDREGNIAGKYYKIKIPPEEPQVTPGTDYNVFDTEFGNIAMAICYDFDAIFDGEVVRKLAESGAELVLGSSLGDYWMEAQQSAKENKIFIAIACEDKYRLPAHRQRHPRRADVPERLRPD
jgi:predicted amidohydrolase